MPRLLELFCGTKSIGRAFESSSTLAILSLPNKRDRTSVHMGVSLSPTGHARQSRNCVDLVLIADTSPTVPKDMISYANASTWSNRRDWILSITTPRDQHVPQSRQVAREFGYSSHS